jgi:3-hydroxyacyl-[acyl-carrier-protein] dehydratase
MTGREQIEQLIPHREPFLLLDEIVECSPDRIVCRKEFRGDEWFYRGHYPDYPLTPGVLLCEAVMQAGAALLASHHLDDASDGRVPVATRADKVQFRRMVRPGDSVLIEAELQEQLASAFFLSGRVRLDGKVAVRLDFGCTLTTPPGP